MFNTLGNSISRSGLVGEWLLDGNALDTSGNGNNGTATNITYIKTDKSYQSQAGSYNGSNSNINLGTNKFPTLVNNCTFTAWIRNSSNSTTQSIFSNGNNGTGGDLGWYFGIKLDGVNNTYNFTKPGIINENTGITPSVGKDDFICLTITSNIGRLYINSVLVWTGANSSAISNNTQTAKIGCHTISSSNTQFYNGNIQGVRVYNRVLSQDEIELLYREGQRLLGPTAIPKYPSLLSGLVGYWDFKGTAHNLVDGTLPTTNTATLTTDRFGNSNSAYSFDGSTKYMQYGITSFTNNQDITISVPVKVTSNPAGQSVIINCATDNQSLCKLYYITISGVQYIRLSDTSDGSYTASHTVNLSGTGWRIITITKSGTTQTIYIDGVAVGTTGNSGTALQTLFTPGMSIGKNNYDNTQLFNGDIGSPIVLSRALSASEVKLLYDLTSQDYIYPTPSYDLMSLREGLVLDLNEQGYDLSGNGNNGTLVNSPAIVRQGRAKGLSYNGTNQYITANSVNLGFNASDRSYECWAKWNTLPGSGDWDALFLDQYLNGGQNRMWRMGVRNNGGTMQVWNIRGTFNYPFITGKTYHFVFNFTSSNVSSVYVDGVFVGTVTADDIETRSDARSLSIGASYYNSGSILNYMNGQIFYPRIRNRVLSDKEIQQLYYSQKANFIY